MKKELVAYNEPKSPISENFRALRTNLQFMNASSRIKVILVTSTLPGEGKSWTAANLAITFAQAGNSVIVLDADMRKGRQFSLFDVPPRPGLSNYLSGIVSSKNNIDPEDLRNFIYESEIENLYVMPVGDVPPNPSELLMTQKMLELVENLRESCDILIIDTPPASLVADSKILSRLADVSIIVASHKETKMDNLKNIIREIENVGGKVGGVVLNKMQIQSKKYEGSYYYGETSLSTSKSKSQDLFIRGKKSLLEDRKEQKASTNTNNRDFANTKKTNTQNANSTKNNYNNSSRDDSSKSENRFNSSSRVENKSDNLSKVESKPQYTSNSYTAKEDDEIKKILNNNEITIDKTQDILNQINSYLDNEKRKMNSGDKND